MAEEFQEQVHSLQGLEIQKKKENVTCIFNTRAITRAWLQLRMSRILFVAETHLDGITHEQTII